MTDIERIVIAVVKDLGEELNDEALMNADMDTRLMGSKSSIDSISLVSLIAEVESRLSEELGLDMVLADERAMSQMRSPFRRVGVLVEYVEGLVKSSD